MNVLFVFTPVHPKYDSIGMRCVPPLAVYYLATILKNNNIAVDIVDPHFIRTSDYFTSDMKSTEFISGLLVKKYDALLFSATSGNWGVTKAFIQKVKSLTPQIPVIVGGVHASYFDEHILQTTPVDFVIRNEGEKSLLNILQSLENPEEYKNIKGLSYKEGGVIIRNPDSTLLTAESLVETVKIDYSPVPDDIYSFFGIETSRGCRFNCLFCSVCHRNVWRGLPADFAVDRIVEQYEEIKTKVTSCYANVFLVDDCFTADPNRAIEILSKLHEKNLDLKITFEARVNDLLTPGFIENIPNDLIQAIQVGVEAGYNKGLKKIRKGITIEQLEECVQLLSDFDLQGKVSFSFIIGFPWETINDLKNTIHTVAYLCDTYGVWANLNWLWLMPSDLWFERQEHGIDVNEGAFDNPLWFADRDYFFKTHPQISIEDVNTIKRLVESYKDKRIIFGYTGVKFDVNIPV